MPVRIASLQTFRRDYPVVGHFKFFAGRGDRPPMRETVLVKLTTDDGAAGWGQCVPSPRWSYETIETVESTLRGYLAPALVGLDPLDGEAIHAAMDHAIAPSFSTGQPICKAGVDLALFDLAGRMLKQSPAERWGRQSAESVTLSWTLNPTSLAAMEADVAEAQRRGYRHFNVKVAPNAAYDLQLLRRLRQLAPEAIVWADANGGYDLETALSVAPRLADLGVSALEQPLPAVRLADFARLRKQGALPILMDEPLVSCDVLREFHQLGLLDGAAIKVSRCGGLSDARRQVEYLLEHGLLFFGSGLTDPDLSLAASLQLFAAYGLSVPAALNGPQYLSGSVLRTPIQISGDIAHAPTGPGLGVAVDASKLTASD
ncbi:MAG: enolase C-terminal domain-like protein [Pirellulaceae bacterium]